MAGCLLFSANLALAFFLSNGSPLPPLQRPAYVIKFAALFPGPGPSAYCDYNNTPKHRNKCDYRVHFDVLFYDDPVKIPYGKFEYDLPDHSDYYVASPSESDWPSNLPNVSYPGSWNTLTNEQYERILRDDRRGAPIALRITVFDRDDVGVNDLIAQQTYNYTLKEATRLRGKIQSQDVACTPEAKCQFLRLKFIFYLLEA